MDGEITAAELRSLPGDDLRIVDIRPPEAFGRRHIPGSENIPGGALTDRIEELDGAERVVTVCPHGKASVQAARLIASYEGVDGPVESLGCGFEGWDGPVDGRAAGDSPDENANASGPSPPEEGPDAPF